MSDRAQALTISFSGVASGGVVRSTDADSLAPPNDTGIISPTFLTTCQNVDLFEGLCSRRDGSVLGDTVQGSTTINGLFVAAFDPHKRVLVAGYANNTPSGGAVEILNEGTGNWVVITPSGGTGNVILNQPWRFAMVPRVSDVPANQLIFGNEGTSTYLWDGTLTANSAVEMTQDSNPASPRGAKLFMSFLSRAWALNVIDENGNRQTSRLSHSIVGDGSDWLSLGSGTVDLDEDPYPIAAGLVMGGRAVILKGGEDGGTIYVLTPTGISLQPVRVDSINPGTNVGVLVPRSFIPLGPGVAFFLGHDAAYIYDGVRALQPFARGVARDIRTRVNKKAIDRGFAHYDRDNSRVELHIPVGSSTTPDEVWFFDIREQKAWGPHSLGTAFHSAIDWIPQNSLTWDTWGQALDPPGAGTREWDKLLIENAGEQYLQWDLAKSADGTQSITYGDAAGKISSKTAGDSDDNGTNIACQIDFPPITPAMWLRNPQTGQRYRPDDMMTLRSATLRHSSSSQWTPVLQVSINGQTHQLVSDGSAATVGVGVHLHSNTYYTNDASIGPGISFQFRLKNTTGDKFSFKDLQCEFTYAGSLRHE